MRAFSCKVDWPQWCKRLNYDPSQFSLTTVSNETGVKIAFAARRSPSHPLFDEIYVYIYVFAGPPSVHHDVHKVLTVYVSQYFLIWAVVISISSNIAHCTTVKMQTCKFTGCDPLLCLPESTYKVSLLQTYRTTELSAQQNWWLSAWQSIFWT